MNTPTAQYCPICRNAVEVSMRYPKYVCAHCVARATSRDGKLVRFFNSYPSGGFCARSVDSTGQVYGAIVNDHVCYIDGHECFADEAHMGGIVVVLAQK